MSTVTTWQTDSSSSRGTFDLGERFGRACKGGEVFLLKSDLGGGKTTFTQGLAKGLGAQEHVGSPTYTIARVYQCRDGIELHHFDFYRLNDPGIVALELSEHMSDPQAVVAVEWGEAVKGVLPERTVTVTLERAADSQDHRVVRVAYPAESSYLMEHIS